MKKGCYHSGVFFKINELPNKFNLKSASMQELNETHNSWLEKQLPWPLNTQDHKKSNIMIPHYTQYDPTH